VRAIAEKQTPLTLCPISNLRLKVISTIEAQPLRKLLEQGVRVTINSDDPSYFTGYINDNFKACCEALAVTREELIDLARNSFTSAFLPEDAERRYLGIIDLRGNPPMNMRTEVETERVRLKTGATEGWDANASVQLWRATNDTFG
jgi:adenosine deaminase